MALDVFFQSFQTRWPWLCELSLISAMLSIFLPDEKATPAPAEPSVLPWMYVNVVLNQFQAILPVSKDLLEINSVLRSFEDHFSSGQRQLRHLVTLTRMAREAPESTDKVCRQVVDRPGVFQLMSQVRPSEIHCSSAAPVF
jgi:hypothetical protein